LWADYVVTAVRFSLGGRSHVHALFAYEDDGLYMLDPIEMSREQVIGLLRAGFTFCTATRSASGEWIRGPDLAIVLVDQLPFISTTSEAVKADNLDGLPSL
jgi:hypothetical protein